MIGDRKPDHARCVIDLLEHPIKLLLGTDEIIVVFKGQNPLELGHRCPHDSVQGLTGGVRDEMDIEIDIKAHVSVLGQVTEMCNEAFYTGLVDRLWKENFLQNPSHSSPQAKKLTGENPVLIFGVEGMSGTFQKPSTLPHASAPEAVSQPGEKSWTNLRNPLTPRFSAYPPHKK